MSEIAAIVEGITDQLYAIANQHPVKPGQKRQLIELIRVLHTVVHAPNGNGDNHPAAAGQE